MYCDKCGKYNTDDTYYCDGCGKQLKHNIPTDPYRNISFIDCYKEFFVNTFNAKGVASFKEFFVIFCTLVVIIALLNIFGFYSASTTTLIITFIPFMTLTARRFHDTNKSGAYSSILGLGIICFMFRAFVEKETVVILLFVIAIICFLITIFLLFKPTDPKSRWNPVNGYMD